MGMIEDILSKAKSQGFSDLFLCAGKVPVFRKDGEVIRADHAVPIPGLEIDRFRNAVLAEEAAEKYRVSGSFDASWALSPSDRFRLNFLASLSGPMVAARPVGIGDELFFDALHLPDSLRAICEVPRGIILVVGATGCGKSTTLGAMVNHINRTFCKHVLTIEDPIEYVYSDQKSLVTQREISSDVTSFSDALRNAVRENPDVIVIGEMRDAETMQVAINAALTGHLVISTVHSATSVQAVERILNLFPEAQREQAALDLGASLVGIAAQRLLPRSKGGMIPAVELLLGTGSVRKEVAERNFKGVEDLLRENSSSGMATFNRSIYQLYSQGDVSLSTALNAVDNPDEFMLQVKGMESGIDAFRNFYGSGNGDETGAVDMRQLLRTSVKTGASDLVLSAGSVPMLRINGTLCPLDLPQLQPRDTQRLLYSILTQHQKVEFETGRELDMALAVNFVLDRDMGDSASCRFRINGFFQRGSVGVVARVVPHIIPDPAKLNLPLQLIRLTDKQQGLILVTGPTGSGKSTTQASLIDFINRTRSSHIITIEDPIEYVHSNIKAVLEQRELHSDTLSFASGLKYALRQDPDVILVGEMRDIDTISAVLTAAETGHLVFATLHTNSAPQTIDRIIDSFPAGQQNQIRQQLSGVLLCVVSQRLLTRTDGKGRVAAFEMMVGTPPVQALIREGKTHQLQSSIETGFKDGMVTLERALEELYSTGIVNRAEVDSLRRDVQKTNAF